MAEGVPPNRACELSELRRRLDLRFQHRSGAQRQFSSFLRAREYPVGFFSELRCAFPGEQHLGDTPSECELRTNLPYGRSRSRRHL